MVFLSGSDTERNMSRVLDEIAEVRKSQVRIEEFLQSFREFASAPLSAVSADPGEASRTSLEQEGPEFLSEDTAFPRQTTDFSTTSWPRNVRLREMYTIKSTTRGRRSSFSQSFVSSETTAELESMEASLNLPKRCGRGVDPAAWQMVLVHTLSVLLLCIDLSLLPMMLAWEIPLSHQFHVYTAFEVIFWTGDMVLGFFTGYETDAGVELEVRKTARHYLRTRFFTDFVLVLCDLTAGVVGQLDVGGGSFTQNFSILRFVKLNRLFRLFRAVRVIGVVSRFLDYLDLRLGNSSGMVVVACRVVFIFLLFTWLNHLISCAWIGIGFHAPSDTGMRWMDLSVHGSLEAFRDTSPLYQYLTAMHWSMAQASVPGLVAVNSWERVACVWLRLVDKIFNCTLISALSAIMVGHTMLNSKNSVEFRKLGIFLKDNGVSNRTALRVRKEAMRRMARPDVPREEHVPVVGQLSTVLRRELRFDMLGRLMVSLPAFNLWNTCSSSIIIDICFEATTLKHLGSDDNLFHDATDAEGAFLVISGSLKYIRTPEMSIVDTCVEQNVERGTWLCEAALWTCWVHTGACEAQSTSRVVLIQATLLGSVVNRHRHIRELASAYACTFHKKLLQCSCQSAITDLVVPGTDLEDVIETMDNDVRRFMGEAALKKEIALTRGKTAHRRALQTLEHEVAHDLCFLFFNADQQLRRIVWWTSARVRRRLDNDLFLVVLGSVEDGHVTPTCRLPETNRSGTDDLYDSLRNLVDLELSPLSPWLQTVSASCRVDGDWEEDTSLNVRSKFRHTMFELRFDGDLEAVGTRMPGQQVSRWNLVAQHLGDVFAVKARASEDDSRVLFLTWITQEAFDTLRDSRNVKALHDIVGSWVHHVPAVSVTLAPAPSRFVL